jgi:hypothetical protein
MKDSLDSRVREKREESLVRLEVSLLSMLPLLKKGKWCCYMTVDTSATGASQNGACRNVMGLFHNCSTLKYLQ